MKLRLFLLALLVLFTFASCSDKKAPEKPSTLPVQGDPTPVVDELPANEITIGVFADIHNNGEYFGRAIDNIFTLTNEGTELDGLALVGDILYTSETATPKYDFVVANERFQKLSQEGKLIFAMGNHEFPLNAKDDEKVNAAKALFREKIGLSPENDVVWGGYHFITAGPDTYFGELSFEQETYVIEHVRAALAESESKPVFLFLHHPVDNTLNGSRSSDRYSDGFETFVKSQPRLIVISGHTHYTCSDPHSIYQVPGGATFLYTSVVYTSVGQSMAYSNVVHDEFSSQALIIKINDKTNAVTIKRFYVDPKEPTYLEGGDWVFDIPAMASEGGKENASTNVYKFTEARAELSRAPYFAQDAKITVDSVTDTSVTFTFPSALAGGADENSYVGYYKIDIFNENGEVLRTDKITSDFFVKNKRDVYVHGFYGIENCEMWKISVTPVSTWYVEGEPIWAEAFPEELKFRNVEFDDSAIYEVNAKDGKITSISGHTTLGDNYVHAVASGSATLKYTVNVEKAGKYRLFLNGAAAAATDVKLTISKDGETLFDSKVFIQTGDISKYIYTPYADLDLSEPGEYVIKIKKSNTQSAMRLRSVKLSRHAY